MASTRVSLPTFSSVARRRHHPGVQSEVSWRVQQGRDGRSGSIFHGVELHVAVARSLRVEMSRLQTRAFLINAQVGVDWKSPRWSVLVTHPGSFATV